MRALPGVKFGPGSLDLVKTKAASVVVTLFIALPVFAWPDLRIVKSGPAQAAPGEVITYVLNYTNVGPVKSTSVVMKDFLPTNVTVLTLDGGSLSGSTISWSVGTLNSNAKGSRSFQVRLGTNLVSGLTVTNKSQIFGSESEEAGKTVDNYSQWRTTIVGGNHPPVAQPDTYPVAEDGALLVNVPGVLGNDSDPDGNALAAVLVAGPGHGTLTLNSNGGFNYRPATNYNGVDSFTYRASDGMTNSGVVTVTLNVTPVNDAPVAQPDSYTVAEDGVLTVAAPGVSGNDSDADGNALAAVLVAGPGQGTLTLDSNGGFNYRPATNYNGVDSFTYRASDGMTNSGVATVTLNVTPVNDAPVAQPDSYTVAEDGVLTVAAPGVSGNDSDVDGNALTMVLGSGPTHGALTLNSNGSFTYVPATNYNGPDAFTYRASDGTTSSGVVVVTLTVTPVNDAPVARPDSYTIAEDGVLNVAAPGVLSNDDDVDNAGLSVAFVIGPAHGTLALNPNGSFSYTPTANYHGPDSFTYRASDGTTNSGIVTVTLDVTPVNDAPVAQPDSYSVTEDGALNIPGPGVLSNDGDLDGDTLTAILAGGPAHGTLTLNPDGSLSYTPDPNYNGPDSFTYRAGDGSTNSEIVTVTLNVVAVNDAPVAQFDAYTVAEDGTLNISGPGVIGNDSDVDGDPLTAILATPPARGALTLNPDGGFVYTPDPNYSGPDSFTYRANDGTTNSGIVTVTLNITPVNDAPVAQPDAYPVAEDGVLTIPGPGLLVNDSDVDGDPLTAILVSGPAHGTLTLNPGGGFSYTPAANYNGPDAFTYRANDGTTNSSIVTVTLNVTPVNDAPVAQSDAYSIVEGGVLSVPAIGVLENDNDIDGDALTAILVNGPAHGTLTLNSAGSFTYTPVANYHGPDAFTYRAYDGTTNSETVTVSLTVTGVNHAPVAQPDSYTLAEDAGLNVAAPGVLVNDADLDGDALIALLVAGPGHGSLTLNSDGSFAYAPHTNFAGADSFNYRVSDGLTNSEIVTVTLTVTPGNDVPLAANDNYATLKNKPLFLPAPGVLSNDSDPDGDMLAALIVTQPAHGQLSLNTNGSFNYFPTTNYAGLDTFTYRASDGAAVSEIATVAITVMQTNVPPDTNNWTGRQFAAREDTVLSIAAPGVLAGIVDADGDVLAAVLVGGTSHGTVTLNADGSFNYLAGTNYFGPDSFQFFVTDSNLNSAVLTATITVLPVNDAPGFVKGGNTRIQPNSGPQTVTNWATQINPGPTNESDQMVTFEATNSNPPLFLVAPAISSAGTLTYTPAANINGTAIVTVIARDSGDTANGGVNASAPQTFAVTINAPPTVQILSPTNGAAFFVPGNFTVLADAQDADGSVSQVDFYLATNKLATVTSAPFFVVLTNQPVGNYPFTAVATDDFGATNSSTPVTVSVIERPPLTLLSSVYYNPQTDYFEQRVRITNPTYSVLNAVRVMVYNLTNTPVIKVGNASGQTNGIPFVETYAPVPPGSFVDMVVEFISPLRVKPNPVLVAQLVTAPENPAPLQGLFRPINRSFLLANRTFFIEFATQTNRVYAIQYSENLTRWKNAQPVLCGNGNWVQWIDNGLPKTDRSPLETPARFYRLIQLP